MDQLEIVGRPILPGGVASTDFLTVLRYGPGTATPFQFPLQALASANFVGAAINSSGHLILSRSDGTNLDLGLVVGSGGSGGGGSGSPGPGFTAAALTNGHLILTKTDGTPVDLGIVIGPPGAAGSAGSQGVSGPGFTAASISSGHLLLTRTDGGTVDIGQVVGAAGAAGAAGATGPQGQQGPPGSASSVSGVSPIGVSSGVISLQQSGATVGQVLAWNGTTWVPSTVSSGSSSYTLPTATTSVLGGVKQGSGVSIAGDGTLSIIYSYTLPVATGSVLGGVKSSATIAIDGSGVATLAQNGAISGQVPQWNGTTWVPATVTSGGSSYTLPVATSSVLGGVKAGSGVSIAGDGTLTVASATISGVSIDGSTIQATLGNPYQMLTADRVVDVSKATGAATAIRLPTSPTLWVEYTVMDGKGDAGTNNITITAPASGTINGQTTFVMNGNNDVITLRAVNSTTWRVA